MLPFLPKKNISSVLSAPVVVAEKSDMDQGLMQAGEDLLRAIESKSAHDVAKAIRAAFSILESQEQSEEVAGE